MKKIPAFVAFGIVGLISLYLLWTTANLQFAFKETQQELKALKSQAESPKAPYELAVAMGRFQAYANKLWFSGSAGNQPLAEFYLHELEEAMEEVEAQNLTQNGLSVSEQIRIWGYEPLEKLEAANQSGDAQAFAEAYDGLVSSCNGCHISCGYSWVQIIRPQTPAFDNQKYSLN